MSQYGFDIVGDVDIVGSDIRSPEMNLAMEILRSNQISGYVGSDPNPTSMVRIGDAERAIQAGIRKARETGTPVGVPRMQNDGTYTFFLPLSQSAAIAAAAAATITTNVQKPFRPERLVLKPDSARDFVVTQVAVGVDPSFAAAGDIPGEMFLPDAFNQQLNARTGQTAQGVSISVRNIAADARPFYAGLSGSALR